LRKVFCQFSGFIRRCGLLAITGLAVLLVSALTPLAYADTSPKVVSDYKVKAALLAQFLRYVEWPDSDHQNSSEISIGIIGEDPYGRFLDRTLYGQTVDGRPVSIRRYTKVDDLRPVHVLIIGESSRFKPIDVFKKARRWSVLTVGEGEKFSDQGGIVAFVTDAANSRVRFHLNLSEARKKKIAIYPRLAKWAERVIE